MNYKTGKVTIYDHLEINIYINEKLDLPNKETPTCPLSSIKLSSIKYVLQFNTKTRENEKTPNT